MGFGSWTVPLVLAQATGSPPNPNALAPLALRRWCGSLTLSSPQSVPTWYGIWTFVAGLTALLLVSLIVQGPGKLLRQVFDVLGHIRLVRSATRRLRLLTRMLSVIVGFTVLSWTTGQTLTYSDPQGKEDYLLLTRSRSFAEIGIEHGIFAALSPLRDVAGLSSNLPFLIVATVILFRASADLLGGGFSVPGRPLRPKVSGWATVAWPCMVLMILYRLASIGVGSADLPLGGCLLIEPIVVPALMAISDAVLLAWVLVELRNAGLDDPENDMFDVQGTAALMPGAILGVVAALPARYLAWTVFLASTSLPNEVTSSPSLGVWVRWQLGMGLGVVQGISLLAAGIVGAIAWTNGSIGEALKGYARLIRAEGGHLAAVFMIAGLAAGAGAGLTYMAVLSLPTATWLLNAADSYAHYVTLPIGLWMLAALIELGERALPEATLAGAEEASA